MEVEGVLQVEKLIISLNQMIKIIINVIISTIIGFRRRRKNKIMEEKKGGNTQRSGTKHDNGK